MSPGIMRRDEAMYLRLLPYQRIREEIAKALSGKTTLLERVPVDSALGNVCAETVVSPLDVPAFPTSAMDGYAIRSVETEKAGGSIPILFDIKGSLQPSSEKPRGRLKGLEAYYVGTGAPVPAGADAVVKIEETRSEGNRFSVSRKLTRWKNVVPRAEDVRRDAVVMRRGDVVNAAGIALLIALGRTALLVFRAPRIGILSTGDELASLGEEEPRKKVNNYSNLMAGYLADAGAIPVPLGVVGDSVDEILATVEQNIAKLDGLITLGGSSVGERDFTAKAVQRAHKSVKVFHGIRLVPVRPTGLYLVDEKPVILLPGHCIAAALSHFLVVKPVLNLLSGLDFHSRTATLRAGLSHSVSNPRAVGALILLKLAENRGNYAAIPLPWGSDRLSSLMKANAFLRLEASQTLEAGTSVTVELLGTQEFSRISRRNSG